VKVEKLSLALCESPDVDDALRLDAHTLERKPVGDRRHDEVTGIREADEAPVEQMVDAGRQQEPILSIEALFIRRPAILGSGSRMVRYWDEQFPAAAEHDPGSIR
jgi:hypothetical protein